MFEPLKTELVPDAKSVSVRTRNYSLQKLMFFHNLLNELVETGNVYPNPTSRLACALLLVAKPSPALLHFTVGLILVTEYTITYQYYMPRSDEIRSVKVFLGLQHRSGIVATSTQTVVICLFVNHHTRWNHETNSRTTRNNQR